VIKVIGDTACAEALVESDPWIPLKVTWLPRPALQPLYLRISGDQGGEVELKVDPSTGALVQLVVIDSPPPGENVDESGPFGGSPCQAPIIDRIIWGKGDETPSSYAQFGGSVVSTTERLRFTRKESLLRLVFADLEPSTYLRCGEVRVGVSHQRDLVEITVSLQSADAIDL
jgi:hypothetical protein